MKQHWRQYKIPFLIREALKADPFGIVRCSRKRIAYPSISKAPKTPPFSSPDVNGHGVINAQLIADQLAANGYLVVMPDLFHGDRC